MTDLVNSESRSAAPGFHTLTYIMTAGTAKLTYSVDNKPFVDVPDSAQTTTLGKTLRLPACRVLAVLTGDATLSINRAE